MNPRTRLILSALGLGALTASLMPLVRVWNAPQASPSAPMSAGDGKFLIDLVDGATDADVADIQARYNVTLTPNSSVTVKSNRLYHVVAKTGSLLNLDALRSDSRVEAAEPEVEVQLNPDEMGYRQTEALPQSAQFVTSDIDTNDARWKGRHIIYFAGRNQTLNVKDGRVILLKGSVPVQEVETRTHAVAMDEKDPNGTRPNDPRYDEQWNFKMINAEEAWKRTRGKGVVVAVIDTGVSGPDYKKGKGCRDFKDTKFVAGYDFVNKDDQPYDDHAHGTHVAGTIAESTNNNEGVAGLAFEASIMPLKVLSASGSGSAADIADAIRWAADHGANVINMSLGSSSPSKVMENACNYAAKKGVVIVCAAGNSFREGVGYPAAYPACIAVSSVGPSGELSKFSSWGKQVALAAPGGDMIDSRDPKDGILQNTIMDKSDDYYSFQGTSMASPHVAAAAALVMAQGIKDPAKVRDVLCKTATPKNDKKKYGAGVLNVGNASKAAEAEQSWKLRHLMLIALSGLLVCFGGVRRNVGLRAAMAGALGLGFFVPDMFTSLFGANSAWNLLSFSALLPFGFFLLARRGPAVKVAGTYALGTMFALFANWHNGTIPFTQATFQGAQLPWTLVNGMIAFGISLMAGLIARKHMR
ncbi:MAG: S8 family peptidase [Armatimonas sp.]